jgi:hypothetical protein
MQQGRFVSIRRCSRHGPEVRVVHFRRATLGQFWRALKPLPAERLEPAKQEVQHAGPRFVHPQPIELFAEHVGFEQESLHGEQRLQLGPFRSTHGLPASQQQPAFPSTMLPHHGAGAKEFLGSDLVEGGTGMLEHVITVTGTTRCIPPQFS